MNLYLPALKPEKSAGLQLKDILIDTLRRLDTLLKQTTGKHAPVNPSLKTGTGHDRL